MHHLEQVTALRTKLQKSLPQRSVRTCLTVADLGISLQSSDDEITEYALNRLMAEPNIIETFNHYELEALSRLIGSSNFSSASGIEINAGKALLQELRNRIDEWHNHGFHRHLIKIQANLTMKDIYDVELLENTLRSDYIRLIYYRSKQLVADIYSLDVYARLNLASVYNGDLLTEVHLEKLGKFLTDYFPTEQRGRKPGSLFLEEVATCVASIFNHFTYAHAVSHVRQADVFLGIDKTTGKAIDVSHLFPSYTGQLISARTIIGDNSNLELYVFVPATARKFGIETGRIQGDVRQKIQQLELLGFNPILVSCSRLRN